MGVVQGGPISGGDTLPIDSTHLLGTSVTLTNQDLFTCPVSETVYRLLPLVCKSVHVEFMWGLWYLSLTPEMVLLDVWWQNRFIRETMTAAFV